MKTTTTASTRSNSPSRATRLYTILGETYTPSDIRGAAIVAIGTALLLIFATAF